MKYRPHGKEKVFSLGVYPTVSLADVLSVITIIDVVMFKLFDGYEGE